MIRPLCVILLAGLAAPVLAQSINPAIEGEGSQTQTLEVLGGAVSVSVESGGALSLGRGEPQAGASATLSVNDLSVGIGNQSSDAAGAVHVPESVPVARDTSNAAFDRQQAQGASGSTATPNDTCNFASADAAALTEAIDAGLPVIIRNSDCTATDPAAGQIIDTHPGLAAMLDHSGTAQNDVVAITIADEGVIVYQAQNF